jgi:hypothetical protein
VGFVLPPEEFIVNILEDLSHLFDFDSVLALLGSAASVPAPVTYL